jgi:6-phosphogluconate dehydrogenase
MDNAGIGLIGLLVMGQSLAFKMAGHSYRVAAFNRMTNKVDDFIDGPAKGISIIDTHSMEQLADSKACYGLYIVAAHAFQFFFLIYIKVLSVETCIVECGN